MPNIYIIGFMGAGKTTVGNTLSQALKRDFVDLDDIIEEKEGVKISDIFVSKGEAYFRKVEKSVLQGAAQKDNYVIACGGGIVLDEENIKIMKKTGIIICLYASADIILDRTKGYNHRPLLNVSDPKARVEELMKLRAPYYAKADYTIDTSELSIESVVEKILAII